MSISVILMNMDWIVYQNMSVLIQELIDDLHMEALLPKALASVLSNLSIIRQR